MHEKSTFPSSYPQDMVTVPRRALDNLIEYADMARGYWDSEFVCSAAEQDSSDKQFDEVVAALGLDDA